METTIVHHAKERSLSLSLSLLRFGHSLGLRGCKRCSPDAAPRQICSHVNPQSLLHHITYESLIVGRLPLWQEVQKPCEQLCRGALPVFRNAATCISVLATVDGEVSAGCTVPSILVLQLAAVARFHNLTDLPQPCLGGSQSRPSKPQSSEQSWVRRSTQKL